MIRVIHPRANSTAAQIFCTRLNVNIAARATIFNISALFHYFRLYIKIRMRIFEIAGENRDAPPAVCIVRVLYHFNFIPAHSISF